MRDRRPMDDYKLQMKGRRLATEEDQEGLRRAIDRADETYANIAVEPCENAVVAPEPDYHGKWVQAWVWGPDEANKEG